MNMNNKQTLTYVRAEAKALGCTLREKNMTINGQKAYKFCKRNNPDNVIVDNLLLGTALNYVCSDVLASIIAKLQQNNNF